jgi:SepF-like predicted cell division protein (DUF552 family)
LGKVFTRIIRKVKKGGDTSLHNKDNSSVSSFPTLSPDKNYLKAFVLHSLQDLDKIESEVESGNIMIVRVSPLAKKSVEDVKLAVGKLNRFTEKIGGDIARLGEERIVITPSFIRIWRKKSNGAV